MKKLLAALIALVSLNAFSQVVYLDTTSVNLDSTGATLIKTSATPYNVTLNLIVPTTVERCEPRDMVTGTNAARCGTYTESYNCGGFGTGPYRRGPNYNPPRRGPNYRPPGTTGPRRGTSIPAGRRYNPRNDNRGGYYGTNICYREVPRTCTYCINPYYVTVDMPKTFDLTFDRFNRDATIEFNLDQHGNLILDVAGVAPGCVKKTIYGSGKNITGAKLKLKRSCR